MDIRHRLVPKIIVVAVVVGLLALAAILFTPSPAPAAPTISWTPSALAGEVARGNSKTVTVSFTSSETVHNVEVRVVPALQPFVQVNPSKFAVIPAGQPRTLNVTFSASSSSPFGTFDGTIQLRQRNTLARPLPVTVLVTVVPLPPDPGEAGKATLQGIDSDGDGVRDDIQRYIGLTYPDSEKTRAALTQVTRSMQTELLDANNKQKSIADIPAGVNAMDCLYFIVGSSNARAIFNELRARILNTRERSEASILFNQQIGGQAIGIAPIGERMSRCIFNPDTMEN